MPTIRAVAALAVLLPVVLAKENVPAHKRFSYTREMDDFSYLGMLSKRDECSDAFGSDARNSNCAPDITLCCTRNGLAFPSCQQLLSKGWCCVGVGEDDKCYVDQASACDEDSAVACTNLKEGTDKACCPKLTTCDPTAEASEDFVRCNINRGDLLVADAAQKNKQTTTSASTSTAETTQTSASSTTSSKTSSTTSSSPSGETSSSAENQNEANSKNSSSAPAGTIAGAVVGGVAGLGLVAGLVFFLMRRRKHKYEAANQAQPTIPVFYEDQAAKHHQQGHYPQQSFSPEQGYVYSPPPSELHDPRIVAELESASYPQQLDSTPVERNR